MIPGQQILDNGPMTVVSLGVAIGVVAAGLLVVCLPGGGLGAVLAGGMIMGTGIAAMHYFGMAAVSMHGAVQPAPGRDIGADRDRDVRGGAVRRAARARCGPASA